MRRRIHRFHTNFKLYQHAGFFLCEHNDRTHIKLTSSGVLRIEKIFLSIEWVNSYVERDLSKWGKIMTMIIAHIYAASVAVLSAIFFRIFVPLPLQSCSEFFFSASRCCTVDKASFNKNIYQKRHVEVKIRVCGKHC